MRQTNQIDLRNAAGERAIKINPGDSAVYQFNAQQSRIGAGGGGKGMYNNIRGIAIQVAIELTQPHTGSGAITADMLPGALGSFNLNTPLFGTLIDPAVIRNGILARHLLEYFCGDGDHPGIDRPVVPATADLHQTVYAELYLPFSQGWNQWGDDFAFWLGWFDTAQLEIFANSSTDPFAQLQVNDATTPATLNSVTLRATLDMAPRSSIVIPPVVTARRYSQAASAGSNGPTLIGVGNNGAVQGCDDMARLMAMLFAHNAGGFTGSGVASDISSVTLPWRDQTQTINIYAIFERFMRDRKRQQWGGTAVSGTAPVAQLFDNPAPFAVDVQPVADTVPLNNANARYTPFVWPQKGQLISHMQRVKGNYPLEMVFGVDQADTFNIYTLEMKQFSDSKVSEMLAAMNVDPSTVSLVPKFGNKNVKFGQTITPTGAAGAPVIVGQVNAKKTFCLPRSVVSNTKAA